MSRRVLCQQLKDMSKELQVSMGHMIIMHTYMYMYIIVRLGDILIEVVDYLKSPLLKIGLNSCLTRAGMWPSLLTMSLCTVNPSWYLHVKPHAQETMHALIHG